MHDGERLHGLPAFDSVRRRPPQSKLETVESFAQGRLARRAFRAARFDDRSQPAVIGSSHLGVRQRRQTSSGGPPVAPPQPVAPRPPAARPHRAAPLPQPTSSRAARCASSPRHRPVRSTRSPWPTSAPTARSPRASSTWSMPSAAMSGRCSPRRGSPNADGSVWTFNLRQGVKWHDGTPFTSADVVATMDRLAGSNLKASIAAGLDEGNRRLHGRDHTAQPGWPVPAAGRCVQPAVGHHAEGLRARHHARQASDRNRRVQADQVRPGHRRDLRGQPRLVEWQAVPRQAGVHLQR